MLVLEFSANSIKNLSQLIWLALPYTVYFLPFMLAYALWTTYLEYIRAKYIANEERIMLEIKIPKEIQKSPAAMELLLHVFYQTYEGELIDKYVKGVIRGWFSLELASFGGDVHFFLNIPKFFKDLVEAQIYSQYPEVEVAPADDYTKTVNYGVPNSPWKIFGWEWKFSEKDAYPIKTYFDYGMEKDPKEEFKIDPMTPMLEFLGSIRPSEQVWFQILVMASKDRFPKPADVKWYNPFTWNAKQDWKGLAKDELETILKRKEKAEDVGTFLKFSLSPGERGLAESVERHLSKYGFDVGIRAIYASKEDLRPITQVGVANSMKQFGAPGRNGFKPISNISGFPNPWQDFKGIRKSRRLRLVFKFFRERAYFYAPANRYKPMVMTTEELAPIYHFPGQVAETPTLKRVESQKAEPPPNLPI